MSAGSAVPPVDLFKVASLRLIRKITVRPMIPRGGLVPVDCGFAMYVRGDKRLEIDSSDSEQRGILSSRQRFAVAHEIAHTFFFDLERAEAELPTTMTLERLCDHGAGFLLMPPELLKLRLPGPDEIDIALVRQVARDFDVSLSAALRTLGAISAVSPAARCIALVGRARDEAQVEAVCFGTGLLRTLPRPALFATLREWLPSLPASVLRQRGDHEWHERRAGRTVHFRKVEVASDNSFLLQAEEVDEV